jgi:hypothetical protein
MNSSARGLRPHVLRTLNHHFIEGGDWFQWQAHYGAVAISPEEIKTVVAYIANQKRHHAEGSLRPEWEKTFDEYEVEDEEPMS